MFTTSGRLSSKHKHTNTKYGDENSGLESLLHPRSLVMLASLGWVPATSLLLCQAICMPNLSYGLLSCFSLARLTCGSCRHVGIDAFTCVRACDHCCCARFDESLPMYCFVGVAFRLVFPVCVRPHRLFQIRATALL